MIRIEERRLTNEIIIHSNFKAMSIFDKSHLYRLFKKEGKYSVVYYIARRISAHIENIIEQEIRENDVEILFSLGEEEAADIIDELEEI